MKPCNVNDNQDKKKLLEQGLGFNGDSITVLTNGVELKIGSCTIVTSKRRFKAFAEWYLEDQELIQLK